LGGGGVGGEQNWYDHVRGWTKKVRKSAIPNSLRETITRKGKTSAKGEAQKGAGEK